jgi:DNA repair protein RecO (recombination protein O)
MPLRSSEAILLDVFDLHEYDQIVTMLTRDFGKRRGVARGARRRFSQFSGQLRPLEKVRATWFEKEGRDLDRLSSLETLRSADRLTRELEGILLGAYLAEHMGEFAQESEDNDHLYRLLDSAVEALLSGLDPSLVARYFEAWVLRLSGLFPDPIACPGCERKLIESQAVLPASADAIMCRDCAGGGSVVSPDALGFFHRIGGASLQEVSKSAPSRELLAECEDICGRVRRAFLQHELKSHRVMRETLASLAGTGTNR